MTFRIYILSAVMALCVSCGGAADDPAPAPTPAPGGAEEHELAFSPCGIDLPSSRAAQALEETHRHIRVFGYKATASGTETVMPGYHVLYFDADDWQYDGTAYAGAELNGQFLKYWDGSAASYEFCAYAPVTNANKDLAVFEFEHLDAHVPVDDAADYDYLVAHHVRTLSPLGDVDAIANKAFVAPDPVPATFHDIVPLKFHHLFSQVEFRVYNAGNTPAYLSSAVVKIVDDANVHYFVGGEYKGLTGWYCTYEDWAPAGNLLDYACADEMDPDVINPLGDNPKETHSTLLASTIEVPQSMEGKQMIVTLIIDDTPISKTFDMPDDWEFDKRYIYYFSFETSDLRPIFVDVEVNDFLRGEIIDNEQTNW